MCAAPLAWQNARHAVRSCTRKEWHGGEGLDQRHSIRLELAAYSVRGGCDGGKRVKETKGCAHV
eukprot:3158019-Pleurochrysis_carterae.AAC.1